MRIALMTPRPLDARLGAVKNRFEFSEALGKIGWETHLLGYLELGLPEQGNSSAYRGALRDFIIAKGNYFDVILYEYDTLPFPRSMFPQSVLLVARPALLNLSQVGEAYPLPKLVKWKNIVVSLVNGRNAKKARAKKQKIIHLSLLYTDLIQVQNSIDALTVRANFPNASIALVPNGLSERRFQNLSQPLHRHPLTKRPLKIAFVGTFDYRKGAIDIRCTFDNLVRLGVNCQLKLIGTKALFQTAEEVMNFFPPSLRHRITIIETFSPDSLPELLSDCRVGLFPSYWESFGFGALEMMAAGLPVVAYSAPGPSDFIPKGLQVKPGDINNLTKLLKVLIEDDVVLHQMSLESLQIASSYTWTRASINADMTYRRLLESKRAMRTKKTTS